MNALQFPKTTEIPGGSLSAELAKSRNHAREYFIQYRQTFRPRPINCDSTRHLNYLVYYTATAIKLGTWFLVHLDLGIYPLLILGKCTARESALGSDASPNNICETETRKQS